MRYSLHSTLVTGGMAFQPLFKPHHGEQHAQISIFLSRCPLLRAYHRMSFSFFHEAGHRVTRAALEKDLAHLWRANRGAVSRQVRPRPNMDVGSVTT